MKKLQEYFISAMINDLGNESDIIIQGEKYKKNFPDRTWVEVREVSPEYDAAVAALRKAALDVNRYLVEHKVFDKTRGAHTHLNEFVDITEAVERLDAFKDEEDVEKENC